MSDESYHELEKKLSEEFDLVLLKDQNAFQDQLADKINYLIQNDFSQLVSILYRIDVSESKLKATLNRYPEENAGYLIAHLIIERQQQKIKTRKEFKDDTDFDDNERW